MRSRDVVRMAVVLAGIAGCGAAVPPVPLTGSAPVAARHASAARRTAPPPDAVAEISSEALRCPLFPDACLATDGERPGDCAAPVAPQIVFASGSATIPRAGRQTLDRVIQDSRRFAASTRVVLFADSARIEPADLAQHRVDAVKDALIARGLVGHGIVTVSTAMFLVDELPAPPTNRVEISLRGCR